MVGGRFNVCVVFCAIVMFLVHISGRTALQTDPDIILGTGGYDYTDLEAPAVSGWTLYIFSRILANPYVGPTIARFLFNNNQFYQIIHLAQQLPKNQRSVFYPMLRLSPEKHVEMEKWSKEDVKFIDSRKEKKFRSALDIAEAYRTGKTTPLQVVKNCLKAVEDLAEYKIFITMEKKEKLYIMAKKSGKRWKNGNQLSEFDGVPIATKDEIDMEGLPLTYGSDYSQNTKPPAKSDDEMIKRIRNTGAIIIGKTNMCEHGHSPLGYNSNTKGPFNAYNKNYMPGCSSSGSGVAVALGIVPMAIGFDGGGSIRIPAARNGVFGLSPTFGRIPGDSGFFHTDTMVHGGPLCATVNDCAYYYKILAENREGHSHMKLYGGNGPPMPNLHDLNNVDTLKDIKFGFWDEHTKDSHITHHTAFTKAKNFIESKMGGTIVDFMIPHLKWLGLSHASIISTEMAYALTKAFDGQGGHTMEPSCIIRAATGLAISSQELQSALRLRGWAFDLIQDMFENKFDVIIMPTTGIPPMKMEDSFYKFGVSDTTEEVRTMKFIFLHNLIGNPAITVPIGYDSNKIPIGFQIMCGHWREDLCLRIANVLQKHFIERELPEDWVDILA